MSYSARCYCETNKCNGALILVGTKRTHERADLRRKSVCSQSIIHSGRIIPHKTTHTGPLLRANPVPAPLIPPIFEFSDPPPVSTCAVEQDMLDRGTLTAEDLAIQVHGGALPNLGPNFHTAEALLDALDYYDTYNNVTARGAQPLTSYMAHSTPKDPEQRALEREFEKIMDEEMWKMDNGVGDVTADVEMTDVDMDLDGEIGNDAEMDNLDNAQIDDDTAELVQPPDDDEDCPDPFEPDDDFFMSSGNRAMSTLPPYILI